MESVIWFLNEREIAMTDSLTDSMTDSLTDSLTDSWTERQLDRETAGQRESWTDGLTERYRWTDSETTKWTYTDRDRDGQRKTAGRYMHGRTSCTGRALGTDSGSLTDLSLLSSDESFWSRLTRSSNSATFWHRSELKRSLTFWKESRPRSLWHSHCVEDWPFIEGKSEGKPGFRTSCSWQRHHNVHSKVTMPQTLVLYGPLSTWAGDQDRDDWPSRRRQHATNVSRWHPVMNKSLSGFPLKLPDKIWHKKLENNVRWVLCVNKLKAFQHQHFTSVPSTYLATLDQIYLLLRWFVDTIFQWNILEWVESKQSVQCTLHVYMLIA